MVKNASPNNTYAQPRNFDLTVLEKKKKKRGSPQEEDVDTKRNMKKKIDVHSNRR